MNIQIDSGDASVARTDDATTTIETRRGVITWTESEDALEVEVPMPGVDPRHLDVNLCGRTLSVRHQTSSEERTEENGREQVVTTKETLRKEVELPVEVEPASADAMYKGGVLRVKLRKAGPKRERGVRVAVSIG